MSDTVDSPATSSRPGRWDRAIGVSVWSCLFLALVVAQVVVAYEAAMHFSGPAIDGPFQLYDALRRIQAGFRPGIDFQFFHGLGIPFLHYLPYRLLGGGLLASELPRELIAALAQPVVFLFAFRVLTGSWRQAVALSAAAMALSFVLRLAAVLFALNGMLGLRAAIPTLLPVLAYGIRPARVRTMALGVAMGAALFLSTEQGLAIVAAYAGFATLAMIRRRDRAQVLESASVLALAGIVFVVCLVGVAGVAGMRGALRYNLRLVPMDQYWYFGSPPNTFVPSWSAGIAMLAGAPLIGGAVVLSVLFAALYAVRFWRAPNGDEGRRSFALGFLALYGFISCASLLGVFTPAYVQPCWRALVIIGLVEVAQWAQRRDVATPRATGFLGVPRAVAALVLAVCAFAAFTTAIIPATLVHTLPHVLTHHLADKAPFAVDDMWSSTLRSAQTEVERHRKPDGELPTVWSTYAGWLEARLGVFHPSFDYIIHALGPANRQAYVDAFRQRRPDLVQTVRPVYSQYEGWIENHHWAFYDELLDGYTVSAATPWSFFWSRRSAPAAAPVFVAAMQVPSDIGRVPLPPIPDSLSSNLTLLEIEVEYGVHNPLRWLPIVGATPRYLVGIEGAVSRVPVSLNPFVARMRFPVIVARDKPASLVFQTFSLLPGASWQPRRLTVFVRRIDAGTLPWFNEVVTHLGAIPDN